MDETPTLTPAPLPTPAPTPTAIVTDEGSETPPVVATHPLKWWQIILIRAIRSSIDALLATSLFTSIVTGDGPTEAVLLVAFKVAGIAFVSAALRNGAELLANLDKTNPSLRA